MPNLIHTLMPWPAASYSMQPPIILRPKGRNIMLLFLLTVFVWNPTMSRVPSSGNRKFSQACSPNGLIVQKLNVAFHCISGKLQLGGCIAERGLQVLVGKTYSTDEYELRCHKFSDQWAQMIPLACWNRGQRYLPSEIMVEEPFWYTCTLPSNVSHAAKFKASGCVSKHVHPEFADSESANRLDPGQSFQNGQYIYTCVMDHNDHGSIRIEPTACLYEGNQISLGEEFMHGRYTYRCQRKGKNEVELIMSGCIFKGAKYEPERKYVWNGFVFECRQLPANKLSHEVVGCTDNKDRWYIDGERWIYGSNPFKYMVECVIIDGQSAKAMKKAVACLYENGSAVTILNPGCMKKIGNSLIKCESSKDDADSIQFLVNEFVNEMTENLAFAAGFKYC